MRKRILLIEDDHVVRESLTRVLTMEGYAVFAVPSGEEGVRLAAATWIDAVLLDLNLPGQGGWEVYAELTHREPLLPIIITTARPNQLLPSVAAGVGALMEKPLDFPMLLSTLRDLLAEAPQERLARLVGEPSEFYYLPASPPSSPSTL